MYAVLWVYFKPIMTMMGVNRVFLQSFPDIQKVSGLNIKSKDGQKYIAKQFDSGASFTKLACVSDISFVCYLSPIAHNFVI
jgi:hypothetical protein